MEYTINDNKILMTGRLIFNDYQKARGLLNIQTSSELIVNLEKLEFIDSSGIGMLLVLNEELNKKSKKLILENPQGQVERVFDVAQIGKLIPIRKRSK